MNYAQICEQTRELVLKAAEFIKGELPKMSTDKIEIKGVHEYVTYVDKGAEKILVEGLAEILPESGFIAEEGTSTKIGKKYNWIIDPLDGTTNFIHGLSPYSISIGLKEDDEIVVGVIYELSLQECFYAWKGSKAYLNGKEIHVSNAKKLDDCLIATGFPYRDYGLMKKFLKSLELFMQKSHGIRRLGSAAADIAYVACGRCDAFYEYGLQPWDLSAGALIVQQAGGKVSDFKGGNDWLFGKEFVCANSFVFDEFQKDIESVMCTE